MCECVSAKERNEEVPSGIPSPIRTPSREMLTKVLNACRLLDQLVNLRLDRQLFLWIKIMSRKLLLHPVDGIKCTVVAYFLHFR